MYTVINVLAETYPHVVAASSLVKSLLRCEAPNESFCELASQLFKHYDTPKVDGGNDFSQCIPKFPYSDEIPFFLFTAKDKSDFIRHRNMQVKLWNEGKFRSTIDGCFKCGNMYYHKYHKYWRYDENDAREMTIRELKNKVKDINHILATAF